LALLRRGKIVAVKGDGGFQLVADARNANAVATLRRRLQDDETPYPLMLANAISASAFVQLGVGEPGLLGMPERPIILLRKRAQCDAALPGVAPERGWLGVMLPSTPLHYLFFHEAAGRPEGLAWLSSAQELALVVTGAACAGAALPIGNDDACSRLAHIADAFLLHDREVVTPCDDTVARPGPGGLQLIRRGRGYAPRPLKLPHAGPPVLALGADGSNTVCVTRGDEAYVSQHIGELDAEAAREFFEQTIAQLLKFLDVKPALVAHDLDPELHASRLAIDYARGRGIPALAVQHSHAHAAAVLAEHQIDAPLTALVLDDCCLGDDGSLWGAELLRVDGLRAERIGSLQAIRCGGDPATRQPWRLAAEVMRQLGRGGEVERRFAIELADDAGCTGGSGRALRRVENASLSCLLDAAAGLLGVKPTRAGAGRALEALAERHGEVAPLGDGWVIANGCLNLLPLFSALADEKDSARGAALLHSTLAAALADWASGVVVANGTLVGAGNGLLNFVLARGLRARLAERGLHLIEARRLPPGDGGLSLGQAWIAQCYLRG
jgi:hydrogenase maturation protein HypF